MKPPRDLRTCGPRFSKDGFDFCTPNTSHHKHFRCWKEFRVRTGFFAAWEDRTSLGLELGFWMSSRTKRIRSPKTLRQSGGNVLRQNSLPKIKCLAFNSFRNSVSKELRKAGPPKTAAQGLAPCSTLPCCSLQKGLQRTDRACGGGTKIKDLENAGSSKDSKLLSKRLITRKALDMCYKRRDDN